MRPCTCNVEHYVVRPNIPSFDWKYEYSDGSNAKCNCQCNTYLADIVNGMTEIRNTMSNLQEAVNGGALSGVTTEQLTSVINERVTEKLNELALTNTKIEQIVQASDSINNLASKVNALETTMQALTGGSSDIIRELTTKVLQEIQNNPSEYNVTNILGGDLTELQNTLQQLTERVNTIDTRTQGAATNANITELSNKLTTLETKVNNMSTTGGHTITVEGKTLVITKN